jgi:GWxTD domain-containing protein
MTLGMRKISFIILMAAQTLAFGQTLQEINYNYEYIPDHDFSLKLKSVRTDSLNWTILYDFRVNNVSKKRENYTILWEGRESLSSADASPLSLVNPQVVINEHGKSGWFSLGQVPNVVVAKVIDLAEQRAWLYHVTLDRDFPVDNFFVTNRGPVVKNYLLVNDSVKLNGGPASQLTMSFYDEEFPAAAPAFSEKQARVSRGFRQTSLEYIKAGIPRTFSNRGLYLFQKDTSSVDGVAVRVEPDYPKYKSVKNLPGPLIYICTKEEYNRLELAGADKKVFDATIMSITRDEERARFIIKGYYRRVELANEYFTSYKEGWKTDRGMIYIVFGIPDKVYKFTNREVWTYNPDEAGEKELTFNFVRSSTIFDPNNFVLVRDKKYQTNWYEAVETWRNARQ